MNDCELLLICCQNLHNLDTWVRCSVRLLWGSKTLNRQEMREANLGEAQCRMCCGSRWAWTTRCPRTRLACLDDHRNQRSWTESLHMKPLTPSFGTFKFWRQVASIIKIGYSQCLLWSEVEGLIWFLSPTIAGNGDVVLWGERIPFCTLRFECESSRLGASWIWPMSNNLLHSLNY